MTSLATLLSHPSIWRGNKLGTVSVPGVSTGFPALDAELPGGGWPVAALTEILPEHEGIGEIRILGHALATLSALGRWLAWIAPPHIPYAPALQAAGIDLSRLLCIKTRSLRETLWAMEQALRDNSCGAVIAWPGKTSYPDLRRLQLAAAGSQALAVLFRPSRSAVEFSPAALRLHLQTYQGDLAVRILKRRGHALAQPVVLRPLSVIGFPSESVAFNHAVARPAFSVAAARILAADPGVI
jgi:hypothetical protein